MSRYCTNYGTKLDRDPEFCSECGTNLSTENGIKISNFIGENDNIKVLDEKGPFQVIEYERDLSVTPSEAIYKYFSSKMNVRPRQLKFRDLPKSDK